MGVVTHVDFPTGAFGRASHGATKRLSGVHKGVVTHADIPNGAFGREGCCAEMGVVTHADFPTGAFGAAPNEATKRARGMPKWDCH